MMITKWWMMDGDENLLSFWCRPYSFFHFLDLPQIQHELPIGDEDMSMVVFDTGYDVYDTALDARYIPDHSFTFSLHQVFCLCDVM